MVGGNTPRRGTQHGSRGRSAITTVAICTCAGQRDDHAVRKHFADAVVQTVSNEHIAENINCGAPWSVELCSRGRAAITAVANSTSAG